MFIKARLAVKLKAIHFNVGGVGRRGVRVRPTDFRFEMRKPNYHLEIGKQKTENEPFSVFCFDNRKRKTKKRPVI